MSILESHPVIAGAILGLIILTLITLAPKSIKLLKWNETGNIYKIKYAKKNDGNYEVRVLSRPENSNTSNRTKIHLLDRNVICTTKPIETFKRAEVLAEYWIKGYENCLKTGQFPDEGNQST